MKTQVLVLFALVVVMTATAREIELKTVKEGETTFWKPDTIEVTQGEKVKIIAKHELEGGFDFHGLFIPELKITEKVDRNKPLTIEKSIPKDMKPGTYDVGCHFHPKHVGAKLVVKPATAKKP